jgi:hypothetical protein
MLNKEFIKKSVFLFVSLFFLYGCDFFEGTRGGVLSFSVTKEILAMLLDSKPLYVTTGEDGTISEDDIPESIDITISGDYEEKRTIPFAEGAAIVFKDIPVNSKIYVEAEAYSIIDSVSRKNYYRAGSDLITVKRGENRITLVLKGTGKLQIEVSTPEEVTDLSIGWELNEENNIYVFQASGGIDGQCSWYVDGELQEGAISDSFTFDISEKIEGTYLIEVVCGDLSASYEVSIGSYDEDETESTVTIETGY